MIIVLFCVPSLAEALHLVQTAANQSNEAMQKIVGSRKNNAAAYTMQYNIIRYNKTLLSRTGKFVCSVRQKKIQD